MSISAFERSAATDCRWFPVHVRDAKLTLRSARTSARPVTPSRMVKTSACLVAPLPFLKQQTTAPTQQLIDARRFRPVPTDETDDRKFDQT